MFLWIRRKRYFVSLCNYKQNNLSCKTYNVEKEVNFSFIQINEANELTNRNKEFIFHLFYSQCEKKFSNLILQTT